MLGDRIEQALSSVGVTKERVERWLGIPCGCEDRKQRLNRLEAWAARIISGATEKAVYYLESILRPCEDGEQTVTHWACGVTTVPERMENGLLRRTLDSLKSAGFEQPRLFVDGADHEVAKWVENHWLLPVTSRDPVIRPMGNWALGLAELYIREPSADRYAMFQDDVIFSQNVRQYLDRCKFPEKGYWNLYTVTQNIKGAPNGALGWFVAPRKGKGALALVFDLKGVQTLLAAPQFIERPTSPTVGFRNIDGGIVNSMNYAGYREFVHNPSLCQHVGKDDSAIKKIVTPDLPPYRSWPVSEHFRGEEFDCMTLEGKYLNGQ